MHAYNHIVLLVLLTFAECKHGSGEPHVFGPGAVHLAEGDKPVERSRKVPGEPGLHPDTAQLLFGFLLLRAPLHRGIQAQMLSAQLVKPDLGTVESDECELLSLSPLNQELEEFWPFKALLTELTRRLSYCVRAELIPLMEVAGVMEVSVEV